MSARRGLGGLLRRPARPPGERVVTHLTTTDMSLDWLLGPQLSAFAAAGFEVVGMSADSGAEAGHVAELERRGVRHVEIASFTRAAKPTDDLRSFVELVRALRRLRPDIVHTHNPKPGVLGRIAARLTRTPLVVNTQHGLWAQPTDRRRRRWPVYAVERIAAAFSDVELVQNIEDVDTLVQTLRVPQRRVELLGNGIDLSRFDPTLVSDAERARCRADWSVADDDVLCLVVGRLVREKGLDEVLDAARRIDDSVRVVIVGPTDDDKDDSITLHDTDRVVMAGRRDDMPVCYAAADLFVTASWREGFPRSAMEAAAMGLPTVASDIRGNRQVIDDGVTGVFVPVRDADALATQIDALAADTERRARFSAAAIARAGERFDQSLVIERTLAAYDRLD